MFKPRLFILIASVLLFLTPGPSTAQTPVTYERLDISTLPGIQEAVGRGYGPDFRSEIATPNAIRAVGLSHATVYRFDSAENAALAFDALAQEESAWIESAPLADTDSGSIDELRNVGDQALITRLDRVADGTDALSIENVVVQRGIYVFRIQSQQNVELAPEDDAYPTITLPTVDIATSMATNGEESFDEVMFQEDGTSTGGLWNFFPSAGDEVLADQVPGTDVILLPAS